MWSDALNTIRCPSCLGKLTLRSIQDEPATTDKFVTDDSDGKSFWTEIGVLLCNTCTWLFPIHSGVPILLTYPTQIARDAMRSWPATMQHELDDTGFNLPNKLPPRGEEFVGASFSAEWATYDYGTTLWTAPTNDRLMTFRGECGLKKGELTGGRFCEIGCGLGITTNEASTGLGAEAWGVDLSQAVFRAATEFKSNQRLHFVQASVFALPFERHQFDFVYSHGVLHHTWSTRVAISRAAELLGKNGTIYVWLYGFDDVRISLARRFAYAIEAVTRPVLARLPSSITTIALLPLIPLYQFASAVGQRSGTHACRYTAQQALHAARDRFTPMFAHRHEISEVFEWFRDMGFEKIQRVDGSEVSTSWKYAIDRNVAVRASYVTHNT